MRHLLTTFPNTPKQTTPEKLYLTMYTTFPKSRNEVYFSTPLSSGGARRIALHIGEEEIPTQTVMKLNSKFAEVILDELKTTLPNKRLTLPHLIGARKQWHEFEYMKFWMYYLSGLQPELVTQFTRLMEQCNIVNITLFNDYTAGIEQRSQEYQKLLDYFLSFVHANGYAVKPVSLILLLPNHHASLGCSFEKKLLVALGVPMREIYLDRSHPKFATHIAPYAPWLLINGFDITAATSNYGSGKLILY